MELPSGIVVTQTYGDNDANIDCIAKAFQILLQKLEKLSKSKMAN